MPNIMLRRGEAGELQVYVPKKDLEDVVTSVQFEGPDKWGGELELGDGTVLHIDPLEAEPKMPITLRAKRL